MTPSIDYLLIGHMTADITPAGRVLGGTVSYAARTIAAFGLKVGILTSANPQDPLINELRPYVDDLVVIPAEQTSTFENIYQDEVRQQVIREVANPISFTDVPENWRNAPLVHFAPLTREIVPRELFGSFPNSIRLLTAQGLLREWGADGLVQFHGWAESEALGLLDWLVLSEEDIIQSPQLEQTYAKAVRNFVLTGAENGGTCYVQGSPMTYSTPQVEVKQPTGAGDVFASGLLAALHVLEGDVKAALQVAAALGATAVTRNGWHGAPTVDEVKQILAEARACSNAG